MTLQQELIQRGVISPTHNRYGWKELQKLRKKGFHTYPNRPLSYSSLKEFNRSPLHYIEYVTKSRKSSDAMIAGKLFEDLLFGKNVCDQFVIFGKPNPEKDFRDKENRKARDEARLRASKSGKELIETQEVSRINELAKRAYDHPFIKYARKYVWKHPEQRVKIEPTSRLKITGIPDLSLRRGKIGVDIKFVGSIADFRERIFGRSYAYWIQAAMYSLIYGYEEFYFFAVQSERPYYAQAFYLDTDTLEILKERLIQDILMSFRWHLEYGFIQHASKLEAPNFFYQNWDR
ncbi:MAG: PD-(D/E)XK nuclease-like domain-containing protein [Bacteroidota bacterium]